MVAVESRLLGLVQPQPRIEGRAERRSGPRVLLCQDLGPHPVQDPRRFGSVGRRLDHPQLPAGERVDAGIHEHLVGVPALADVPALPSSADALRHPGSVPVTPPVTEIHKWYDAVNNVAAQKGWAPGGSNPEPAD